VRFAAHVCCCSAKGMFDNGRQGGAFFQEGVVTEYGIDFDELAGRSARRQSLHVIEGHQLILRAPAISVAGVCTCSIHRMQSIDSSRSKMIPARYFCTCHRRAQTDSLYRESEAVRAARRCGRKPERKLDGTAVGGHRQRTGELSPAARHPRAIASRTIAAARCATAVDSTWPRSAALNTTM